MGEKAIKRINRHPPKTTRYLDRGQIPLLEKLVDIWFSPKPFESEVLYERLGAKFLKRYVPTGGDFFIQRFGVRIVEVRGDYDSLIHFEQLTRLYEALHLFFFLFFLRFSLRRWRARRTSFLGFLFALLVYVLLILSPVALQRYNRIRIYHAIRLLAKRSGETKNSQTDSV